MNKAKEKKINQEAVNHLNVILDSVPKDAGYVEIRTFPETEEAKKQNKFGRSYFLPTDAAPEQIEAAVRWSEIESKQGRGVFVGMNPRSREEGTKSAVKTHSAAFLDLDLEKRGIRREDAIAEIKENSPIPPTYISESGGGLHVAYYFKPTDDPKKWEALQETLYERFQHIGADRSVVTDSARVLRLTGFPNWKYAEPRQARIIEFTPMETKPSFGTVAEVFDVQLHSASGERKRHELPEEIVASGDGVRYEGRNALLHKEASRLRGWGYEFEEIFSAVMEINERRAKPPLDEDEVRNIVQSVIKYTPNHTLGEAGTKTVGMRFGDFYNAEYPEMEYIIYGLYPGEIGMVQAKPNIGKTTMMLNVAMAAATGTEYYPLLEAGRPKKVMYLDFENRASFLQLDMKKMAANFTEEEKRLLFENLYVMVDEELFGQPFSLSNPDHFEILMDLAKTFGAEIIIIDTLIKAFSLANENDNSEVERVVNKPLDELARKTQSAVLLVHHIGKAGETADKSKLYRARGASSLAGAARLVLDLDSMKDGNGRAVKDHVVLNVAKIKGKPFDDVVYVLDFPKRWFEPAEVTLPDQTSVQEIVWSVVTEPMRREEIVERVVAQGVDVSESTVKRALKLGVSTGRIRRGVKQGYYEPADAPETAAAVVEGEPDSLPLPFPVDREAHYDPQIAAIEFEASEMNDDEGVEV